MAASTGFRLAIAFVALILVENSGFRAAATSGDSIGDILKDFGLPEGLVPGTVLSYTLAENGKFQVTLSSTCTTKFGSEEVYYKKSITGNLSYGKITNLSGIQAHEFFWVSVTGIELDQNNPDIIWFEVGFLSKSLSIDLFQVPPSCNSLSNVDHEPLTFSRWLPKVLGYTLEVDAPAILDQGTARKMLL